MAKEKPFKIKLHPPLDQKTADNITRATLEAMDGQLYKPRALTPDDIGKNIKGEGIYLGTYAPVDRDGVSLKKVFNVFAAPEDLYVEKKKPFSSLRRLLEMAPVRRIGIFTYVDAVKHVASLKNWHGHNGAGYASDKELHVDLKNGSYKGGWIIPPWAVLYGRHGDNDAPDSLKEHKDKGSFRNTFKIKACKGLESPDWYWSSTEKPGYFGKKHPSRAMKTLRFSDDGGDWDHVNSHMLSCRPVRLVERVL